MCVTNQSLVDGETSTKVTMNVWSRKPIGCTKNQIERDWQLLRRSTTVSTRTFRDKQSRDAFKDGKRRQLVALDAKRAFVHADALTETYVKPPPLRDTERCWLLRKCMYGTLPQQDGIILFRNLVLTLACPVQAVVHCAFGHSSRDLDMVVHGDDFIVAGCGDDPDWLSQKLNEKLQLVQKPSLGPGYDSEATVLNRCDVYSDSGLRWEADAKRSAGSGRAWTPVGASTVEPGWR